MMRYEYCRSDVLTAVSRVKEKNTIIPRWKIEDEIANNPGRYPTLTGKSRFVIRLAISSVLVHQPGVSVMARKKPVFVVAV
jgi:hypothetical protein